MFSLYRLKGGDYEPIPHSEVPELSFLDMELLTRCVLIAQTSRLDAAHTLRQAIHPSKGTE